MLAPRLIPTLLLAGRQLVKTVNFTETTYVGDPLNAVRIFNEMNVDELLLMDITVTQKASSVDLEYLKLLARECRMPIGYSGGVVGARQAITLIELGIEKVGLSSAAVEQPSLIRSLSTSLGSQSLSVVIDVRHIADCEYRVFTHNGRHDTGLNAVEFARAVQELGAGEIIVNSIDRDGLMNGYDLELCSAIAGAVSVPVTFLGGAGRLKHFEELFIQVGVVGAAGGSFFVFHGKQRAVMLSYPDPQQCAALALTAWSSK